MMWNLIKIIKQLGTVEQCVAFSEANDLVLSTKICRVHHKPMRLAKQTNRSFGSWFCPKGQCRSRTKISRIRGTFFDNIKIELVHVFYLLYAFAWKWNYKMIMHEDPHKVERNQCLNSNIIADWLNYCREVVILYHFEKTKLFGKIGGPGKLIEIGRSKFGKHKFRQGKHIEDKWVLCMVEDKSDDIRLEVCPDNMTADILLPLIEKHIEKGSIIDTEIIKQKILTKHGYYHKSMNNFDLHEQTDSNDSQTEGTDSPWRVFKRIHKKDSIKNPLNYGDAAVEHLWRSNIVKLRKDPFIEIVNVIKHVYKSE